MQAGILLSRGLQGTDTLFSIFAPGEWLFLLTTETLSITAVFGACRNSVFKKIETSLPEINI